LKPRWQLIVVALLCVPGLAQSQQVVVVPGGGPDPYAMSPAQSNPYWWGQGLAFPTTSCFRDRFWIGADCLYWWTDGMETPPLVTSSPNGTTTANAGVLGLSSTSVLFGGNELNDDSANGLRLRSGMWLFQGRFAVEGEFYRVDGSAESFGTSSNGSTILARPYFDITDGTQSSQLIAYPNLVSGGVSATSDSQLSSGLINIRSSFLPIHMLGCADGCDPPDRVDWIVGYRVLELKDDFAISDNRRALVAVNPDTINSSDSFSTKNRFQGLQLGVTYQAHYRRLWMESMLRVALGNNDRTANIAGGTTITDSGVTNNYTGGLLAQRSNIGNFEQSEFTMIPEFGLNFGIRVTRCLHAVVGYSVIYFPGVWRATEQIDLDLNPGLIPPESISLSGALRPQFRGIENDYLAHGLSFGAELKF
jgi:hypothetical protein